MDKVSKIAVESLDDMFAAPYCFLERLFCTD